MAVTKITEKTVADTLKDSAHFLVTQQETIGGTPTETLRRVPINMMYQRVNQQLCLSIVDGKLCQTYDDGISE